MTQPSSERTEWSPTPSLALVHHGHQHLITDGYDNHEGLSEVLESFSAVLAIHLRYRVPVNLHLSGTLLEAAAWHAPDFFGWVEALRNEGLVEVLGSAYSQPVLTLFGAEHNLRQAREELELVKRHLGVAPGAVTGFWVPERVWHTPHLGPLVRSSQLANGGYRFVLLDDRLAYPAGRRAEFDRTTAPGRAPLPASAAGPPPRPPAPGADDPEQAPGDGRHLRPWRIEGADGLVALPISGDLRYAIPPRSPADWQLLLSTLEAVGSSGEGALALYADDLEKTAGVGPWTNGPWRRSNVEAYEGLVRWLSTTERVETVLLTPWLDAHPPRTVQRTDPGTFYEVAAGGAGEDYQHWWSSPPFAPYRTWLEEIEAVLAAGPPVTPSVNGRSNDRPATGAGVPGRIAMSRQAKSHEDGSDRDPIRRLWDLAWKQLMAATYETAWHGLGADPDEPAPWARATASHARAALHTVAAARFGAQGIHDHAPAVWSADLDGDGVTEVVLANHRLFAVVSPRFGGRLVALYDLGAGALVVGNPADDWNWQEELHRYMQIPANHPGALADVGHENDRWELTATRALPGGVEAELCHAEPDSPLNGSVKRFRLSQDGTRLEVTYDLAGGTSPFSVDLGLSPDYLTLLREGRGGLRVLDDGRRRGAGAGVAQVWVELPPGEPLVWEGSGRPAGHAVVMRAAAYRPSFTLRLGVGDLRPPDEVDLRAAALEQAWHGAASREDP